MTMSASLTASALTVAPAAENSESGKPDLMPAPGSTDTSAPSALYFFTVSGEAATRGSDGSISLATAIFIGPPAARELARSIFANFARMKPVLQAKHEHERAKRGELLEKSRRRAAARASMHQVRKIAIRMR